MKTKWIQIPNGSMVQVCVECNHGPGFHVRGRCDALGWEGDPAGPVMPKCKCQSAANETIDATTDEDGAPFAYRCPECEAQFTDDSDVQPLYECSSCGSTFTEENSADGGSNRCPDCNKFAAKISDMGCPDCGNGELEEIEDDSE